MPPTVCRERGIHRSSERRALFPTGLTIQALATFLVHRIQHAKVFVSPTITIAKQTGLFFQVEDSGAARRRLSSCESLGSSAKISDALMSHQAARSKVNFNSRMQPACGERHRWFKPRGRERERTSQT